jgi:hypothetical protein
LGKIGIGILLNERDAVSVTRMREVVCKADDNVARLTNAFRVCAMQTLSRVCHSAKVENYSEFC